MALTNAEKQARHRERIQRELEGYRQSTQAFLDALAGACERGRCAHLTNRLPETTWEAQAALTERLEERSLIVASAVRPRRRRSVPERLAGYSTAALARELERRAAEDGA